MGTGVRGAIMLAVGAALGVLMGSAAAAQPVDPAVWCSGLPGTWVAPTCTVSAPLTVSSGAVLEVPDGVTLRTTGPGTMTIATGGTVLNEGTIDAQGLVDNRGTLDNQGDVLVSSGGMVNRGTVVSWGLLQVTGTLNNDGSGLLDSRGFGRIVVAQGGRLINAGQATITNGSVEGRDSTSITNSGTVLNEGLLINDADATFDNEVTGLLDNYGTVRHLAGTLTNSGGTVNNNGYSGFGAFGTIDNHAAVVNSGITGLIANSHVLHNHPGATLTSTATLANGCVVFQGTRYCRPDIDGVSRLVNEGTLDNGGQLDNHGTIETSGAFTNTGVVANIDVLVNTGTVDNVTTWDNTGTLDTTSGTFTNGGVLNADCTGAILGAIVGTAPASSCTVESVDIDGPQACQDVGGRWVASTSACHVSDLVVQQSLGVRGVTLVVGGTVVVGVDMYIDADATVIVDGSLTVHDATVFGRLSNQGDLSIHGAVDGLGEVLDDDLQVVDPVSTIRNEPGATLRVLAGGSTHLALNDGTVLVEGQLRAGDEPGLVNRGEIEIAPGGQIISAFTTAMPSGPITNAPAGRLTNHGTILVRSDSLPFRNDGVIDNHGEITNEGRFVIGAGGTMRHYDGAQLENFNDFTVEEDATFLAEANSVILNATDAFIDVAGDVFTEAYWENVGTTLVDLPGDLVNVFDSSFHNSGEVVNRGRIRNSMDGRVGRFENTGLLTNEAGALFDNGIGILDNTASGIVLNRGTLRTGSGPVTNLGRIVGFPGSSVDGPVAGNPPVMAATTLQDCRDDAWTRTTTADGSSFADEDSCVAYVVDVRTTIPDGLARTQQIAFLIDVLADVDVDVDQQDGRRDVRAITMAVDALGAAREEGRWSDPDTLDPRRGHTVFDRIAKAVKELDDTRTALPEVDAVVAQLVAFSRDLAAEAIDAAQASDGDARRIDRAREHLEDADAEQARGRLAKAVRDHRKAWQDAVRALR